MIIISITMHIGFWSKLYQYWCLFIKNEKICPLVFYILKFEIYFIRILTLKICNLNKNPMLQASSCPTLVHCTPSRQPLLNKRPPYSCPLIKSPTNQKLSKVIHLSPTVHSSSLQHQSTKPVLTSPNQSFTTPNQSTRCQKPVHTKHNE